MPAKINTGGKQDFSLTFDQFNGSLLNKSIHLFNKQSYGPQIFEQFLKSNVVHNNAHLHELFF